MAFVSSHCDDVRLWSRHGRNRSAEFAAIPAGLMALPFTRIVLDGEAVAHCPNTSELQRAPAPLWVRYSVLLRLRPDPRRRRGSARARARRAPGPAPQAPQARRRRDHLQRSPDRRRRRSHVPPRLPHGARRNRLETHRQPLQELPVPELGEGQTGLRMAVSYSITWMASFQLTPEPFRSAWHG
jgi:hypothetical protein